MRAAERPTGTSDPEHSRDQDPDEDRNQQRDADAPDRQVVDAPQNRKPMAAELAGEPAFALETAVWTLTHETDLEPTSGGPLSLGRGTNHQGRPSPAHTHGRTYRARTGAATCRTDMASLQWNGDRGAGFRTRDLLLPKQARYRTAPHPEVASFSALSDDLSCAGRAGVQEGVEDR